MTVVGVTDEVVDDVPSVTFVAVVGVMDVSGSNPCVSLGLYIFEKFLDRSSRKERERDVPFLF